MTAVVVLGGTGHIGAAIARQFDAQGFDVVATGRREGPVANLNGTGVHYRNGDDRTPGNLAHWVADCDVIVDAATPYPIWRHGAHPKSVVAAARARSHQIIALARQHNAALVHVSSFTTLPAQGGLTDRLRLAYIRGLHPYFEVKEVVERDVLSALAQGLAGCVANPTACFGPYDLKPAEQAFIPMLMQGKVKGSLRHPVNVVDVRDVAGIVAQTVAQKFPARQVPISGHNTSVEDLIAQICAIADVDAPRLRAPMAPTVAGAYLTETAAALAGRKPTWPSLPMLLTAAGTAMDQSPAQAALDHRLRPLPETLADAIAWYRTLGHC